MGQTRTAASKALAIMALDKLRKKPAKLTPAQIAKERARAESAWRSAKVRQEKRKRKEPPKP